MTASKLQPALIAGVTIGLLSGIPIVNIGNCCCCLWVVSGGALAAYLLQQKQAAPIDLGDAALVGLMAGAIGAVVSSLISLPFTMMAGAMNYQAALDQALNNARELPPEARQFAELDAHHRDREIGARRVAEQQPDNRVLSKEVGEGHGAVSCVRGEA